MSDALEQASLIMVPSGYENGTLGSLKPLDGTGDFTFSRGSDISATRVNEDGYIEKGYENLLLQSNSFDTTWVKSNAGLTSGQAGYDGSNDAWLLSRTGTFGQIIQNITNGGVQTFSIYAKAGTLNWIRLTQGSPNAYFDLSGNGAVGTASSNIDAAIELVGDGWFRCSITSDVNLTSVRVYVANGDNDLSGTSGSIYIQDAMLNQGLVAYPYVETTTAPVAGGILEDMPRLDYSGSCPALLLEPQRTNVVTSSEHGFVIGNVSIDYNNAISPEGYQNAFKSTATGTTSAFTRLPDVSGGVSNPTISVFVKYGNNPWLNIIHSGSNGLAYFNFNCQTGDFGTSVGSLTSNLKAEDYGNGWWRVSATFNYTGGGSFRVYMASSGTTGFASGSTTIGNYFYGYGFQIEQDATYPTSYIPTYGTSQTRLADSATASNVASLIGQTEGTIFIDGASDYNENISKAMVNIDYNINNRIELNLRNNFISIAFRNSLGSFFFVNTPARGDRFKVAVSYQSGNTKFYLNGALINTKTETLLFGQTLSNIQLNDGIALQESQSELNKVILFPTALSDDECIALTTIS